MKRAAFFFGSGISRLSGAPTVDAITESLLEGAWRPHTDGRFYPLPSREGALSVGVAKDAQDFLRILKDAIDPVLEAREHRKSHYEDLYSAVLQIVQDEMWENVNPLIAKNVELIRAATAHLHVRGHAHIDDNRFASLADRVADLVQWTVSYGLRSAMRPVGIGAVSATAHAVDELDIFSLNHDLLLEAELAAAGIDQTDGFGAQRGNVRVFDGQWDSGAKPIRLMKLHGSINWYLFRFPNWDQYAKVHGSPDDCVGDDGKRLDVLDRKPLFLTGTNVKEQAYGIGLFGEMFGEFRKRISNHRTLICCGYGWGDKGINIRLNQWLRDAAENRIVILHNDPDDLLWQKRFWYFRWDDLVNAGKVVVIPKWLSECSVAELEPYFDN